MQETELKLELSQAAAAALLKKHPFESAPTVLLQKSIYFDTAGWELSRRGLSLRIRQSGNERIQTVKVGDGVAAGSFTREEWERPVADDTPVLDEPQIRDLLGVSDRRLAPVFEIHVKRHRWNVTEGESTIEVAVDVGKVVAADREAPLCEIELERKAGPPAALFALARKVDVITAAHLGVLSKAERGYRLLGAVPGGEPDSTDARHERRHGFCPDSCSVPQTVSSQRNRLIVVPQRRCPASGACVAATGAVAFLDLQIAVRRQPVRPPAGRIAVARLGPRQRAQHRRHDRPRLERRTFEPPATGPGRGLWRCRGVAVLGAGPLVDDRSGRMDFDPRLAKRPKG